MSGQEPPHDDVRQTTIDADLQPAQHATTTTVVNVTRRGDATMMKEEHRKRGRRCDVMIRGRDGGTKLAVATCDESVYEGSVQAQWGAGVRGHIHPMRGTAWTRGRRVIPGLTTTTALAHVCCDTDP